MRATLASLILLVTAVHSQLETCDDVGCPIDPFYRSSECSLDGQQFEAIGVLNFTTSMSASPLQWTVGYIQPPSAEKVEPDGRVFYLGQPASVDIRQNASVTACALFFNGISSKLRTNNINPHGNMSVPESSCDEALTSSCVSDWLQQAQKFIDRNDAKGFSCQAVADGLRSSPPSSCKVAGKSWGKVTVRNITGSAMPMSSDNRNCSMTEYAHYSLTRIADINATTPTAAGSFDDVTPVFILFRSVENDQSVRTEAHLSCLKPVVEVITDNSSSVQGSAFAVNPLSAGPLLTAAGAFAILLLSR